MSVWGSDGWEKGAQDFLDFLVSNFEHNYRLSLLVTLSIFYRHF